MATVICLCLRVKLKKSFPPHYKVYIMVTPGSHADEESGLFVSSCNRMFFFLSSLASALLHKTLTVFSSQTLYQSTTDGKRFVECLREENIVPSIKVDKSPSPLPGSNNESWCQVLDGLASRSAEYYKQGARFAKWKIVVSILSGPLRLVVKKVAWGLARYAAISQDNGLVSIVEPEILLDGDHATERSAEVGERV